MSFYAGLRRIVLEYDVCDRVIDILKSTLASELSSDVSVRSGTQMKSNESYSTFFLLNERGHAADDLR